ncbi:AMP-binding protein [Rhodococcus opacus]|uniref:acetate--CoA ligase n=1 Tax=Rhodococcus opacus TaxID=37919 RepID=A0AAX3YUS3_RHOOP|nr:AMP-binding protein [Rhodococcus opacus]MCZ4590182.1 AMP-binding protein [Rhodococcus opacus]WLF52290.1 AMP-binding protein [Rhodococcus opacus]
MTTIPLSDIDDLVWQPGRLELDRSRILAFARQAGCADVDELGAAANEDPGWFWGCVADWLQLEWQREPTAVFDQLDAPHETKWFPGGALNVTDNAVDRWIRAGRGNDTALSWELEDGARGWWSFSQLSREIDRVARGLIDAGIGFGDTVGIQLPMVREAAVAQLACAKIGAISVPIFSGFGTAAVVDRLRIAGAKAHIMSNGFHRRGREVAIPADLPTALADLGTLTTTIVVPLLAHTVPVDLPGPVHWDELGLGTTEEPVAAAECPTDHPMLIAFTSGTTGAPKGVVLGHAGFAVKAGSDAAFSFDIGPGDVSTWITDPGWIMSPIIVLGGLIAGSAVALYAGTPDWPDTDRIWNMVRELGVTMMGVSPTLIRSLMDKDTHPEVPIDTGLLRVLASSGEAWTPDAYEWLYSRVGGGHIPIINYSGGTEVSGAILSNTTAQPIHPCGFAGPLPGMGADIVDSDGRSLARGLGELALRQPSPGMPLTFWANPDRYYSTYWNRWDGTWYHGDWVEVDDNDIWYVRGRSDDTLKIAGKRLGPAEVESVVNGVDQVVESAAIGVPDDIKGEALVVFARVAEAKQGEHAELPATIAAEVGRQLGKPLTPKQVHIVDSLPRTRSGKILRRVIRAVYLGNPSGDTSSLDDPAALDLIRDLS